MSQNLLKWSLQGFSVLRHPNHLLLTDVNNRNVIIDQLFHAASDQSNRDFFLVYCLHLSTVSTFLRIRASYQDASSAKSPMGAGGGGAIISVKFLIFF